VPWDDGEVAKSAGYQGVILELQGSSFAVIDVL
jgi:hypothetical protein